MSPVRRTRLVSFVVFLVLTAFLAPVHAARLALVIGNDAYVHVPKLRNARADARAMAHALEDAGFKVSLALDQDRAGMNESLRRFRNNLSGGDEAVFFYAGHGVQLGGTNYLLPVDMKGNDVDNVVDDAIRLQRVLDDFAERKTRFALAIVDACRDNPFVGSGRNLETRGLVPVQAANGQMVIYSAGAGQKALDRLNDQDTSPNGLFTRVFVKELGKPGVPIHDAVRNVRQEVVRLANGVVHEQVPAIYDQSIGDFYFGRGAAAGGGAGGGGGAATPAQKPAVREAAAEKEYWEDAKRLNNVRRIAAISIAIRPGATPRSRRRRWRNSRPRRATMRTPATTPRRQSHRRRRRRRCSSTAATTSAGSGARCRRASASRGPTASATGFRGRGISAGDRGGQPGMSGSTSVASCARDSCQPR